ncbi:ABC transporter ATP-binding protein [Cytobacillus suaedae]|nr:ABC transporter ATP-binding protein [Cytobacillus suaedae]
MSKRTVLEINQLSKVYSSKTALYATNLKVYQGECIVLCGGNGAGKSTLIRMITGLERQSSGTVTFHTSKKKCFGFMPDNMNFPKELTLFEILSYYASFLNVHREKIEEVIKRVGLWNERNHRVSSFSKGMTQRVNLAQCLLADVELYILDEPTNGLDPYWVIKLKDIIKELKNDGKTIILSSHIMRDIIDVSDRIFILFNGKICGNGSLEEIYKANECTSLEDVFLNLHQQYSVTG